MSDERNDQGGEDRPYRVYRAGEPDEPKRPRESGRARDEPARAGSEREAEQGDYSVYRARRGLRGRLRPRDQGDQLRELARRRRDRRGRDEDGERRRWTIGRVLKWIAFALAAWVALSVVLFFVSAQLTKGVSDGAEEGLSPGGSMLTGSTVLVLGSDARPGESTARADSILVLRVGFGSVRRLSILRDSEAEVPGHGVMKINTAYALGGPALMIETVERFMGNGLKVNHVIEVNFEDFPDFIDALGGIDVKLDNCLRSNGLAGTVISLKQGEHHLSGYKALKFARVRENECDPTEDDRDRARRQQQVFSGIRSQALSPSTFVRLPWVSWQAPRTIRSDLKGPGLSALFADLITGGSGKTRVLESAGFTPGGNLLITDKEREKAVDQLLGKRD